MMSASAFGERKVWSNEEINDLADWANSLTIDEIFFLKETFEDYRAQLVAEAYVQTGVAYVQ